MNISKILQSLANSLNKEITNLNYGGCGIVAYLIGEKLENIQDVNNVLVKSVAYGSEHSKVNINHSRQKMIENDIDINCPYSWVRNCSYSIFEHLVVSFNYQGKDFVFDSKGLFTEADYQKTHSKTFAQFGFTIEEMKTLSLDNTKDSWNCMFDRNQIPKLEKIVYNHLVPKSFELSKFSLKNFLFKSQMNKQIV